VCRGRSSALRSCRPSHVTPEPSSRFCRPKGEGASAPPSISATTSKECLLAGAQPSGRSANLRHYGYGDEVLRSASPVIHRSSKSCPPPGGKAKRLFFAPRSSTRMRTERRERSKGGRCSSPTGLLRVLMSQDKPSRT
jgi:hypothetical protein